MQGDSTVIFVSDDPADAMVFERILGEKVLLERVGNLHELQGVLENGINYDALLCDWFTWTAAWKDALRQVLQHCPESPVIGYYRSAAERQWVEVERECGTNLLTSSEELTTFSALGLSVATYHVRRLREGEDHWN